jgi:hypothetical protein
MPEQGKNHFLINIQLGVSNIKPADYFILFFFSFPPSLLVNILNRDPCKMLCPGPRTFLVTDLLVPIRTKIKLPSQLLVKTFKTKCHRNPLNGF